MERQQKTSPETGIFSCRFCHTSVTKCTATMLEILQCISVNIGMFQSMKGLNSSLFTLHWDSSLYSNSQNKIHENNS